MRPVLKWVRDNSLSLAFAGLFCVCFAAQFISGLASYNETLSVHGRSRVTGSEYFVTGDFLAGVFSNWQAALLQLACLIIFGASLYQRGASHSRKTGEEKGGQQGRRGGRAPWAYRNSLSLAFGLLFALAFVGHTVAGWAAYNQTRGLAGQPSASVGSYLLAGSFWFKTMQTWQAEFFAIGVFLVLSIYLRQQGSAESKPVESSDDETGEANK